MKTENVYGTLFEQLLMHSMC